MNAGYQTNISLEVPWEIIVMNMSNSGNVLITTYSQCVIMSDLLFDVKMKNIILLNLISEKDGRKYADYLKKYFFNKNNTNYNVPENKEEYILMVKEYEKDK